MNKEIEIPEGYEARIEGNKVIIELMESKDERIRKHIIEILERLSPCHWDGNEKSECIAYLEKQKEQKPTNSEKPKEWSEEDEKIYKVVLELLNSWSNGTIGCCIIPPNTDRYINWFKSLPERFNLPPKQEWSEEDEEALRELLNILSRRDVELSDDTEWLSFKLKNWLKTRLRSWPHWKPSEEQMDILDKVYHYLWADRNATADMQDGLGDFIDELKSL